MSVEEMRTLREQGLSYRKIGKKFDLHESTVRYHLNDDVKDKKRKQKKKQYDANPLKIKIRDFLHRPKNKKNKTIPFTEEEFLNKVGDNPKCYLTGVSIDLNNSTEYSLDHITPSSLGGENSLSNCGLSSTKANQLKGFLTLDELRDICELFLANCERIN